IVPFANRFRHSRHETPRNVLQARLSAPWELSGALNKALVGLRGMRERSRFAEPKACQALVVSYQAENDGLAAWLDEHTTMSQDTAIPQSELHEAYTRHCRLTCRRPAS